MECKFTSPDRFLNIGQVCQIVSIGETKIRHLMKIGKFPRPYKIEGVARVFWSHDDIQKWIAAVKAGGFITTAELLDLF